MVGAGIVIFKFAPKACLALGLVIMTTHLGCSLATDACASTIWSVLILDLA